MMEMRKEEAQERGAEDRRIIREMIKQKGGE